MLFGHNPELTELAHRLSSEITHMPTCAVAEFTFNATVEQVMHRAGIQPIIRHDILELVIELLGDDLCRRERAPRGGRDRRMLA
jgi:hypothetical protein